MRLRAEFSTLSLGLYGAFIKTAYGNRRHMNEFCFSLIPRKTAYVIEGFDNMAQEIGALCSPVSWIFSNCGVLIQFQFRFCVLARATGVTGVRSCHQTALLKNNCMIFPA